MSIFEMTDINDKDDWLTSETSVVAPAASVIQLRNTTIVKAIQNENRAAYGRRIIRLKDGWIEK